MVSVVESSAISGKKSGRMMTKRGEMIRNLTDQKVLQSVIRIALSKGERAVTMESVSRDSGVAKTTLYRRYKNRMDMLANLNAQISGHRLDIDRYEPSREGLEQYIRDVQETFEKNVGITHLGSLLSAQTPFLHHLASESISSVHSHISELITCGQRIGTFPLDTDPDMAADSIIGGMVCGSYASGVLPKSWAHRMITFLFPFGRMAREDRAERQAAITAAEHMTPQKSREAAKKVIDEVTHQSE
jgi:AcrR family transcriptional regulator